MTVPEQKLINMRAGAERFGRWLEDQMVYGLAALESDPYGRIEQIAAQLTDAQLPGPAGALREWTARIGGEATWAEDFARELGYWHLQCKLIARVESTESELSQGVLAAFGHRVRAATLQENEPTNADRWTCVGIELGEKAGVYSRRTYWCGTTPEHRGTQLVFNYGSPLPPTQNTVGTVTETGVHVFPGGLPGRIVLPANVTVGEAREVPHRWADWHQLRTSGEALLRRQPWRRELPVAVGDLTAQVEHETCRLVDVRGAAFAKTLDKESVAAWRLLATVGSDPFTLYGVLRDGRLVMHSVWHGGRLHEL